MGSLEAERTFSEMLGFQLNQNLEFGIEGSWFPILITIRAFSIFLISISILNRGQKYQTFETFAQP